MKIVDLTQDIYTGMPLYPGHLKTVVWEYMSHDEVRRLLGTGASYQTRGIVMSDHGSTHVDSIHHCTTRSGAMSIEQIPLEWCFTDAVCVDVSYVAPRTHITKADLEKALKKANQQIKKGDTILLYTATFDRKYGKPEYLNDYPGLDREASYWLADSGIVNIGIDSPSIDNPADKTYPAHTMCGERDVLNTENLANLGQVVNKRFTFVCLPLKIRDGTGSPVRAIALFQD